MNVIRPTGTHNAAPDPLRTLLHQLESVQPGEQAAIDAVSRFLAFGRDHPDEATTFYAMGFLAAQRIAKSAGDMLLVKEITRACLEAVNRRSPKLKADVILEARILICGEAWHLQRSHRLLEAMNATEQGLQLARRVGIRIIEALGMKCMGRLERLMAETQVHGHDSEARLASSISWLQDGQEIFRAIDAPDELGDCLSLEARTWLVKYRNTNNEEFLANAFQRVNYAEKLISPGSSKDYMDLLILKAELEFEAGRLADAKRLIDSVVEHLQGSPGSSRSEILARALRLRGMMTENRKNRAAGINDLEGAEKIFARLEQDWAIVECRWRKVMLDLSLITELRIPYEKLKELEREAPDPEHRIRAVRRLDLDERSRVGIVVANRLREIDWAPVLRRVDLDERRG